MYQFNYTGLSVSDKPTITCIVPQDWLSKGLPTMGAEVIYLVKSVHIMTSSEFVFEFTEDAPTDKSIRTIGLNIMQADKGHKKPITYRNIFEVPAKIHCREIENPDASNDWCMEVVLLNHFFGCFALTASNNNVYLDFGDLLKVMSISPEYTFEFGIGDTPRDILPGMSKRLDYGNAKCSFAMIFCNESKMLMTYLKEVIKEIRTVKESFLLTDIAVDQEKMLISVLVGR